MEISYDKILEIIKSYEAENVRLKKELKEEKKKVEKYRLQLDKLTNTVIYLEENEGSDNNK